VQAVLALWRAGLWLGGRIARFRRGHVGFVVLQDCDDLLFLEPSLPHTTPLSADGLQAKCIVRAHDALDFST
jgi:hypothetical protein